MKIRYLYAVICANPKCADDPRNPAAQYTTLRDARQEALVANQWAPKKKCDLCGVTSRQRIVRATPPQVWEDVK